MSIVTLENMEFHAFHGCLEHEKKLGNKFEVTVSVEFDTSKAGRTDDLNDTINYQQIYDVVKAQMEISSNLIEHVAQRILDALVVAFPVVQIFTVKLSKHNPPLGGKVPLATIELTSTSKRK